jgi:hypothetical protein
MLLNSFIPKGLGAEDKAICSVSNEGTYQRFRQCNGAVTMGSLRLDDTLQ